MGKDRGKRQRVRRSAPCHYFFLAAQLIHRCQCGVVAGLERIPLLAHALQLRAAHRCLLARLLGLLLCRAELGALRFQLLAELRQTLISFQQPLLFLLLLVATTTAMVQQ